MISSIACLTLCSAAGVYSGDEMIADSYEMKEVEDGFFFEVEGTVSLFKRIFSTYFVSCNTQSTCSG